MSGLTVEIRGIDDAVLTFDALNATVAMRVREVIKGIAQDIMKGAKERCPVDTGRLRSSIHSVISEDGFGAEIGTNVEYASCVEFGTAPHTIKPRNKPYLVFKKDGRWIHTKEVNHPGTRPQPYMFPAVEEQQDHYVNQMKAAIKAGSENPYQL